MFFTTKVSLIALCASSALAGPFGKRQGDNFGNGQNNGNNGDLQTSTTLDPSVIAPGFALTGQEAPIVPGAPSLTSTNNFINFCAGKTITDGKQIRGGSCNPAPMGDIPSTENMPSSKFIFPANGDTKVKPNEAFTVTMAVSKWQLGNFVNAQKNYYSGPQQLNGQGQIIGHSHIVIESIPSLDSTEITNPADFSYFKGVTTAAADGVVSVEITKGLPAGFYRLASINAASNHQPVLAPVAQHGSMDDMVYFTVGSAGGGNNNDNVGAALAPPAGGANPNLQSFAAALGGIGAPAVSAGPGAQFTVAGDTAPVNDLESAIRRSCEVQVNTCSDEANATGNQGAITVAACGQQGNSCRASNNLLRRSLRFARD